MTAADKRNIGSMVMVACFNGIWVGNFELVFPVVVHVLVPGWRQLVAGLPMALIVVSCFMQRSWIGPVLAVIGTLGLVFAAGASCSGRQERSLRAAPSP
jgi:hypothetical protein